MISKTLPNGQFFHMKEDDFIISITDTRGIITYCNQIFINFSQYSESELLGSPHNIIRHPAMPKAIFKLLWDTIPTGKEFFGYIVNLSKQGYSYWVYSNVSSTKDINNNTIGYFSVRRKPNPKSVEYISEIYKRMIEVEKRYNSKDGITASYELFNEILQKQGVGYEEFIHTV